MKSDEGFSNMLDKQMLNQQVHENVIPKTLKENSKTPTVAILLGFFFISNCNECAMNN